MSLIGALNIGKSATVVSAGGDPDDRQQHCQCRQCRLHAARSPGFRVGGTSSSGPASSSGPGVDLTRSSGRSTRRWRAGSAGAVSDNESAHVPRSSGSGGSSRSSTSWRTTTSRPSLSTFFNGWSNLANKPQDIGLRQIVLQNGQYGGALVQRRPEQVGGPEGVRSTNGCRRSRTTPNGFAQQIADLNQQIADRRGRRRAGQASATSATRCSRSSHNLMDVKTVEQGSIVNVYVGSEPLVIGTTNRGVGLRTDTAPTGWSRRPSCSRSTTARHERHVRADRRARPNPAQSGRG